MVSAAAFYLASLVAVLATLMVVTRDHPVHALLYLVVSFLAVAVLFYLMGAPFMAALEVIVYAGAIVVLFVFVVMMLALGPSERQRERRWLSARDWAGAAALSAVLLFVLVYVLAFGEAGPITGGAAPAEVGAALYGPYLLAVELASMLLLAGLVGAYHLGREAPR